MLKSPKLIIALGAVVFFSPWMPSFSYSGLGTWEMSSGIESISQRVPGGDNIMGVKAYWDEIDFMRTSLESRQQRRGTRRPVGNQSLYRNFRTIDNNPGNSDCGGNNVCTWN